MTILFAPSETKNRGGEGKFDLSKLSFDFINRHDFVKLYEESLEKNEGLDKLFSTKKDIELHKMLYHEQKTLCAIQRYTGVAYDYLEYEKLPQNAKYFLQRHLLIFSNLYGVLKPQDAIPYYKLKQGASLSGISMHSYYKKELGFLNDRDSEWLNLSANYYDKFFMPKHNLYDIKFLKEGKVVSHWAKAYRGLVLKECAINEIDSIQKLLNHEFEKIKLINVEDAPKKSTLIYEVL